MEAAAKGCPDIGINESGSVTGTRRKPVQGGALPVGHPCRPHGGCDDWGADMLVFGLVGGQWARPLLGIGEDLECSRKKTLRDLCEVLHGSI